MGSAATHLLSASNRWPSGLWINARPALLLLKMEMGTRDNIATGLVEEGAFIPLPSSGKFNDSSRNTLCHTIARVQFTNLFGIGVCIGLVYCHHQRCEDSITNLQTNSLLAWTLEGSSAAYYEGRQEIESSKGSYDQKKQEDLWERTISTIAAGNKKKKKGDV